MRSSRYEAHGKFGEHERCVKVARGVAESNSRFLREGGYAQLTYEPIVLLHFQPDGVNVVKGLIGTLRSETRRL